ncbi:Uncharacterised protein [Eubacterium limosum]|uniref:Uncharacterized protein n=1 Tax=Eubacterium limosum TaxID=1736 RepID=A0A6N3FQY0_EUBLI
MTKDELEMKRRLEVGNFARDNGRVLRAINVLQGKWVSLGSVREALDEVENLERSLIYLERAEYMVCRHAETREYVEIEDADDQSCEVTLTHKGIQLALYFIEDPAVKV